MPQQEDTLSTPLQMIHRRQGCVEKPCMLRQIMKMQRQGGSWKKSKFTLHTLGTDWSWQHRKTIIVWQDNSAASGQVLNRKLRYRYRSIHTHYIYVQMAYHIQQGRVNLPKHIPFHLMHVWAVLNRQSPHEGIHAHRYEELNLMQWDSIVVNGCLFLDQVKELAKRGIRCTHVRQHSLFVHELALLESELIQKIIWSLQLFEQRADLTDGQTECCKCNLLQAKRLERENDRRQNDCFSARRSIQMSDDEFQRRIQSKCFCLYPYFSLHCSFINLEWQYEKKRCKWKHCKCWPDTGEHVCDHLNMMLRANWYVFYEIRKRSTVLLEQVHKGCTV